MRRIQFMTDAPDAIKRLVETFGDNIDSYRSSPYNETQVRREFIDPMFKTLGWDVDNEAGHGGGRLRRRRTRLTASYMTSTT